jgi:hypothetical protein
LDTAAIGGLVGSVVGFAPFVMAHLNDGVGILAKDSSQTIQTMVARSQSGIASEVGVGLGWKIGQPSEQVFITKQKSGPPTRLVPTNRAWFVVRVLVSLEVDYGQHKRNVSQSNLRF